MIIKKTESKTDENRSDSWENKQRKTRKERKIFLSQSGVNHFFTCEIRHLVKTCRCQCCFSSKSIDRNIDRWNKTRSNFSWRWSISMSIDLIFVVNCHLIRIWSIIIHFDVILMNPDKFFLFFFCFLFFHYHTSFYYCHWLRHSADRPMLIESTKETFLFQYRCSFDVNKKRFFFWLIHLLLRHFPLDLKLYQIVW